jgi:hypothetical protein
MIHVPDFGPGQPLTTEFLAALVTALRELQNLAVVKVEYPLSRGEGVLTAVLPPLVFPVLLETDGGAQGDEEDPASWTYTVSDAITGRVLAETVDPTAVPHRWQRPVIGPMVQATFGYAHWTADLELALGWINETLGAEACGE